jgi:hypothetical protein
MLCAGLDPCWLCFTTLLAAACVSCSSGKPPSNGTVGTPPSSSQPVSLLPASGGWQDAFAPYPGARKLCQENILGFSDGQQTEIFWQSYAIHDPKEKVVAFYEASANGKGIDRAHGFMLRAEGNRVLSVHASTESYPSCSEKPRAEELTVVIVSRKIP